MGKLIHGVSHAIIIRRTVEGIQVSFLEQQRQLQATWRGQTTVLSPRRLGFDPRSSHVGFVVDKVGQGQVFFEYFGFSCQFSFHRLLHIHHLSSGAGTIGQLVGDVPTDGLSLTAPQETKRKLVWC
jgi:hypothetical protein